MRDVVSEFAADVAALGEHIEAAGVLFARPEVHYLIERNRTGLLTADEAAQLAQLRAILVETQEVAAALQAEADSYRPRPMRWLRHLRRRLTR